MALQRVSKEDYLTTTREAASPYASDHSQMQGSLDRQAKQWKKRQEEEEARRKKEEAQRKKQQEEAAKRRERAAKRAEEERKESANAAQKRQKQQEEAAARRERAAEKGEQDRAKKARTAKAQQQESLTQDGLFALQPGSFDLPGALPGSSRASYGDTALDRAAQTVQQENRRNRLAQSLKQQEAGLAQWQREQADRQAQRERTRSMAEEIRNSKTSSNLLALPEMQDYSRMGPLEYQKGQPVQNFGRRVSNALVGITEMPGASLSMAADTAIQALRGEDNGQALQETGGYQAMDRVNRFREKAVEGLSPGATTAANVLMGVGDVAATLPLAAAAPAIPIAMGAAQSGAQKAYEVTNEGGTAQEALARGGLSGGITAATSAIPISRLVGRFLAPLPSGALPKASAIAGAGIRQGAEEALSEGAEYALNAAADELSTGENTFSARELGQNMLLGGLVGGLSGAGVSALGTAARGTPQPVQQRQPGTRPQASPQAAAPGAVDTAARSTLPVEPTGQDGAATQAAPEASTLEENASARPEETKAPQGQGQEDPELPKGWGRDSNGKVAYQRRIAKRDVDQVIDFLKQFYGDPLETVPDGKVVAFATDFIQKRNAGKAATEEGERLTNALLDDVNFGTEEDPHTLRQVAEFDNIKNEVETLVPKFEEQDFDLSLADDRIPPIQRQLRSTRIRVPEELRRSIPDYTDFRRRNFGRLRLTNDQGIGIDSLYEELNSQYPDLFPEEILTTEDQLMRMADIAGRNRQTASGISPLSRQEGTLSLSESLDEAQRPADAGGTPGNLLQEAEGEAFDQLRALAEQYGQIPAGEFPRGRNVTVPSAVDDSGQRVRRYARTMMEADAVSEEGAGRIAKDVAEGKYNYTPVSQGTELNRANAMLETQGVADTLRQFQAKADGNGAMNGTDIALGERLLQELDREGDYEAEAEVAAELAEMMGRAGYALQMGRLLKRLGPSGQLYYLERVKNRLNRQKKQRGRPIEIDPKLQQELLSAQTEEEANVAVEKIKDNMASQIPATFADKWNAWRYLAMLGNPKTQIRNLVGNVIFRAAVGMKNAISTAGEAAVSRLSGQTFERTKSWLNPASKRDQGLIEFGKKTYDTYMGKRKGGGGKYSDTGDVTSRVRIFRNPALEGARKLVNASMEGVDNAFKKNVFSRALAGYLKANGLNAETATAKENAAVFERAQAYAEREALRSTFQDASVIAQKLNEIKNSSRVGAILGGGLMPFTGTPINILRRGIEYSPIGLMNSGATLAQAVQNGTSPAEALDQMGAGLTGTGLLMLGAWLGSQGILTTGKADSQKEAGLDEAEGRQDYAIQIPGVGTYTLDWAAPAVMPMFVGAELSDLLASEEEMTLEEVVNAFAGISEPIMEMSMLSGLSSALTSYGQSTSEKLTSAISDAAGNYFSQAIPSVLRQTANALDPIRRTSYTDNNLQTPGLNRAIEQVRARIPGGSADLKGLFGVEEGSALEENLPGLVNELPPRLDVWGKEDRTEDLGQRLFENFLSPGYFETDRTGKIEEELRRVYDGTLEGAVLPRTPQKSMSLNDGTGQTVDLTQEQYTALAKAFGQGSREDLADLFQNPEYQEMSLEQQAKLIQDIYDYNLAIAKDAVVDGYEMDNTMAETQEMEQLGVPAAEYMIIKRELNGITGGEGASKSDRQRDYLFSLDRYSSEQKQAIDEAVIGNLSWVPIEDNTPVDYSSRSSYLLTMLSDSGQEKFERVRDLGYTAELYAKYYPIVSQSKKKEEVISDLMQAGLTEIQAREFYRRIKKTEWP